ncbi:MAG: PDDEXK nuclease domain-containing protein [Leptospirales bacterium]
MPVLTIMLQRNSKAEFVIDVNSYVMYIGSEFMVKKSPDNNMDKNTLIPAQKSEDYTAWLIDLKARIRGAEAKAAFAVNQELVLLYWHIGREILDRQTAQGWGTKVVDRLADDLCREFPDTKGFSPRNLKYMRAFAETWPDAEFVQGVLAQLPWYHQIALLDKIKTQDEREWYAKAAIEHGWSRNVLVHQIETELHKRQGAALTNFHKTLPAAQAEIAQQLIKDPCVLDFMTLDAKAKERDLENALVAHVQKFMMELGKGFAFIGRQYHLEAGDQDYYLDLLFYNYHLHSFVVIDLKIDDFKPEYAGKMQFYLSLVDDKLKSKTDQPTIGLILCKSKNGVIVEYALRESTKPMGVAEYKVQITQSLPADIAEVMPSIEEFESELSTDDNVITLVEPPTPGVS